MGWFGFGHAEKSSGSTGRISNVKTNVKSDSRGTANHVLVSESSGNPHANHTHFYKKSSGSWGATKKGKG